MPTSSVIQVVPVYSVTSAVPGVSNPAQLAAVAADSGTDGGPNAQVTFSKAVYNRAVRGGPDASYPATVTMDATVEPAGNPSMIWASEGGEPRTMAQLLLKVTTDEDPGALLGEPLTVNDRMTWAGKNCTVMIGTIPVGSSYLTTCMLTA